MIRKTQAQTFKYGVGKDGIEITCSVPVYTCSQCQFTWADWVGEEARHAAICRHFGLLTPAEILAIRDSYHLSQAEFSRITGLGEASLSRWETGAQLQNAANDRLLRLVRADPRNLRRLQELADADAA